MKGHDMRMAAICLVMAGFGLVTPIVLCTVFPLPESTIKERFSNDAKALELKEKIVAAEKRMTELHERLARCEGYVKPPVFTHAKYKYQYSMEQINEWLANGWTKTNEFGWSILEDKINNVLPDWLDGFIKKVDDQLADHPDGKVPKDILDGLIKTEEEVNDFIAVQRSYIDRTGNWDEWCRKGPWLLEDSPPKKLAHEIQLLTDCLEGRLDKPRFMQEFFGPGVTRKDLSDDELKQCLEAKQTVYNWYHGFAKGNDRAMIVELTPKGFEFRVNVCLFGEGAREEAAAILKKGIERFWRGIARNVPFSTAVTVRFLKTAEEPSADCVKIRIGAQNEKEIWPSDTELHYDFDEETAAHEFGHAIGFRDRYRDIYDMQTNTYKTYQWDLFNLMSAQNGPNPVVTDEELDQVVTAYWNETTK